MSIPLYNNGGDLITQLPTDHLPSLPHEIQLVDTLFRKHKKFVDTIVDELKDSILIGMLFIVISLPQTEELITRFLPSVTNSMYGMLVSKALLLMVSFWIIKYFYLARK